MNMRKGLTIILALLSSFVFAQDKSQKIDLTQKQTNGMIKFEKKVHNFGQMNEGQKVSTTFKFYNTGTDSVTLTEVKAGCGCTIPKWPKNAIAPGDSAEIMVTFNSRGKNGVFTKSVFVKHNGQGGVEYITIKGIVKPKVQATPENKPATQQAIPVQEIEEPKK
jgi:hypothetical protein